MEITEVRVKLVEGGRDKLRAFCSITIDDAFVVRDLKIIDGTKGLFVAMPSRKLTARCPRCGFKNQVRCNYCNDCGTTLSQDAANRPDGRSKIHADIAHPIHTECRERIQSVVVESYLEEVDASRKPGYRPRDFDDEGGYIDEVANAEPRAPVLAHGGREEPSQGRGNGSPPAASDSPVEAPSPDRTGDRDRRPEQDRRPQQDRRPEQDQIAARGPVTDLDRDPRARDTTPGRVEAARPRDAGGTPDRGRDERTRNDQKRRSSTPRRGPLSEMPPPDDNFSAGIF